MALNIGKQDPKAWKSTAAINKYTYLPMLKKIQMSRITSKGGKGYLLAIKNDNSKYRILV